VALDALDEERPSDRLRAFGLLLNYAARYHAAVNQDDLTRRIEQLESVIDASDNPGKRPL
jgi:hypothetical protein